MERKNSSKKHITKKEKKELTLEEERDKLRKELLEPEKMCSTKGYITLAVLIILTVILIVF